MKKIDLLLILKEHFSHGEKLYSTSIGECEVSKLNYSPNYPILVLSEDGHHVEVMDIYGYTHMGLGEQNLFPSETCRDWSKFLRKKDLPDGTFVMVRYGLDSDWVLAKYKHEGFIHKIHSKFHNQPGIIVPFEKFNPFDIKGSMDRRFIYNELLDLS